MQVARGGPSGVAEMARLPATKGAGGVAADPSRASSLWRLGEPVSDAEDGQQVPRPSRVRLDLFPDVLDVRVDCALVRLESDPAHGVEQLRPREHAARLLSL